MDGREADGIGGVFDIEGIIEELDDLLTASHCGLEGGVEAAELQDGGEKAGDIGEKSDQDTEGDLLIDDVAAAEPEHDGGGEHAEELDRGQKNEGEGHGVDVGGAVLLVDGLEALLGGFFLGEGLDGTHTADILGQITDDSGDFGAGFAEGDAGLAGEEPGGEEDEGQDGEGEEGELGAHAEHDDDDADEDDDVADEGDDALGEELVDFGHVVDDAGDGDAGDVVIVIAEVEALEVAEKPGADFGEHFLTDPGEQVTLGGADQEGGDKAEGDVEGNYPEALRIGGGDVLIDGDFDEVGGKEGEGGFGQGEEEGQEHAGFVGFEVGEQAADDVGVEFAGVFCVCAAKGIEGVTGTHPADGVADGEAHGCASCCLSWRL